MNIFALLTKFVLGLWRKFKVHRAGARNVLREFIYLDEVSLLSLLSSLKGEVTEKTSDQLVDSITMDAGTKASIGTAVTGAAEITSRFQTSNSRTTQTFKKATVQSWFKELYTFPKIKKISVQDCEKEFDDIDGLKSEKDASLAVKSGNIERGDLVEFRIRLSADPIFRASTMIAEFADMADEMPEKYLDRSVIALLEDMRPMNKVLNLLLVGLIPIRAEAVDYQVAVIGEDEYIVRREAANKLDLETKPLTIVGVTDHLAYWKDIRRVLFSNAELTILARVAQSGLQKSWTPVKLVDLFSDVSPDFAEQINKIGKLPFSAMSGQNDSAPSDDPLVNTFDSYRKLLTKECSEPLSEEQSAWLDTTVSSLASSAKTVEEQKAGFDQIKSQVAGYVELTLEPEKDLELRNMARDSNGLPLFAKKGSAASAPVIEHQLDAMTPLLDVEVIAIYW